jgi:ParB/RepB/Spo0J family partition protein
MNNRVPIDQIDVNDTSYCISYPLDDDLLTSSIGRFGVLVPVGLLKSDPAKVVIGFKRIAAARKAGVDEIPCVFLDVDDREAILAAISDNLKRPLNTVEKARCLEKMIGSAFPSEDVLAIARMIGLPAREKTLTTVVEMASLEEPVRAFIVEYGLSLAGVEQLLSFDNDEVGAIVRLMSSIRMTSGYIREALRLLMLIKVRNGHIGLDRWEGVVDVEGLIKALTRETHPLLTGLEERLGRIRETSALPPHIRIQVDPVFEKESIDIQVRARSAAEVDEALEKLGALSQQGVFRSILELTHGTRGRN